MSRTGAVSPAVEALSAFIETSIAALEEGNGKSDARSEGLLFLGAWSDALPRLLIEDPVLAPTDKVVWQVIKLHALARGATAFPSYETIGRLANVRAQATLARALAILRVSRWLTLCARVRDTRGRYRGNVYALHDEPLALGDTMYLDPDYMRFLEGATTHRHGRVRSVAAAAHATISDDVHQGLDVTRAHHSIERRSEALKTVHSQSQGGFFSFNRQRLTELQGASMASAASVPHESPSSDSEGGVPSKPETVITETAASVSMEQNSEGGDRICSSRSIGSTTTPEPSREKKSLQAELVFPDRLSANHEALARIYLERVPSEHRQSVLDELEGRLRAERRGAPAVYDPLRFLKRLCDTVVSGEFVPNLGLEIQVEREQRRRSEEQLRKAMAAASESVPPPDTSKPLVQRALRIQAAQAARSRDS